jgi:hypothetical protein
MRTYRGLDLTDRLAGGVLLSLSKAADYLADAKADLN